MSSRQEWRDLDEIDLVNGHWNKVKNYLAVKEGASACVPDGKVSPLDRRWSLTYSGAAHGEGPEVDVPS